MLTKDWVNDLPKKPRALSQTERRKSLIKARPILPLNTALGGCLAESPVAAW